MKTQYEIYLEAENERLAKENANVLAWSRLNKKLTDRVAELEAALRELDTILGGYSMLNERGERMKQIARIALEKTDED